MFSFKGYLGESKIKRQLHQMSYIDYKVLNDVLIVVDSYSHQIDHVVISRYGIFVIETKNYRGRIEGKVRDNNWVQLLGNKKFYFLNPVKQNKSHIKALSKLLNVSEDKIFNIIYMAGSASYGLDNYENIIPAYGVINHICTYNKIIIYNVNELYYKLLENNITDSYIRSIHSNNARYNKKINRNLSICPLCGNDLIEKNGRNGLFIGCKSYPRCTYTRDINKDDY